MIRYEPAPDLDELIKNIVEKVGMEHINLDYVVCMRSHGSKAQRTLARCHAMSRILRIAMKQNFGLKKSVYVIEILAEEEAKMSEKDKIKTMIHELMHIPKSMGGGFLHHSNHVTRKRVNEMWKLYSA